MRSIGKQTVRRRRSRKRMRFSGLSQPFRRKKPYKTSPKSFLKWWHDKKRSIRYARQQFKPYAIVTAACASLLVVAILWASGVFGQFKEVLSESSGDLFVQVGFSVQHVSVTGRNYTSKEGLHEALSVSRGDSLFDVDIIGARRRIEALDWVDKARVMRFWPGSLQIEIVERRPAAIWQLNGELALVDRDGEIISSDHLDDFANLPHVVGKGAAQEATGLIDLLDRYPVIRSRVRAAVRVSGRRWNLRLDNGMDVKLPDYQEDEALRRLLILDDRHRLLARDIAAIDLRMPDRMFISLRSNEVVRLNVPGLDT